MNAPPTTTRDAGWPWYAAVLALIALLHGLTLGSHPGPTGDNAEFQYLGRALGVSHPTGYPLYLMTTHLFQAALPWGTLAWKINFFSLLCGLAALGCLLGLGRRLGLPFHALGPAAVWLAISPTWWKLCTVAEVYALHAAFTFATLWLFTAWAQTRDPRRLKAGIALHALSYGNHLSTIFLLTGGRRTRLNVRNFHVKNKPVLLFWLLPALLLLFAGLVSTRAWLGGTGLPAARMPALILATLAACVATLANLSVRWMRWHFLLRTLDVRLRTRESLLAFTSLLPMILTPWAAGEVLLFLGVRRQSPHPLRIAAGVWLASRGADALSLLLLAVFCSHGLLAPVLALFVVSTLWLSTVERRGEYWRRAYRLYLFIGLSVIAWMFAAAGLFAAMKILGSSPAWRESVQAFTGATLSGSLSGMPAGIMVTGGGMIRSLLAAGAAPDAAIWAVAAVRWGTVGFSVALGLAAMIFFRRALHRMITGAQPASQGHFDDLSASYAGQIPEHIRDRLVDTKSAVLARILERWRVPADGAGLDIGCGQGWYLARFARAGHPMSGCDPAAGQISLAREFCAGQGVSADLRVCGAEALPFPDHHFHFAYTINVFHHITDPATLAQSLREVTRVLKPGAPLIVFEMNTLNPLFRFYMSYVFPFLREIDDGTEVWLTPGRLPAVTGAVWNPDVEYITFAPDFLPRFLAGPAGRLESWLEKSPFRRFSAHFAICLVKDGGA